MKKKLVKEDGINLKKILTFLVMIAVVAVLGIIVIPHPLDWGSRTPEESAQRNCFANQRVLLGAVQIYQEENPSKPLTTFGPTIVPELLRAGCLKTRSGLTCFRVNRQRSKIYLLEQVLAIFSPVLVPVEEQFEGEFLPGSTTLKLRCRNHGSPE